MYTWSSGKNSDISVHLGIICVSDIILLIPKKLFLFSDSVFLDYKLPVSCLELESIVEKEPISELHKNLCVKRKSKTYLILLQTLKQVLLSAPILWSTWVKLFLISIPLCSCLLLAITLIFFQSYKNLLKSHLLELRFSQCEKTRTLFILLTKTIRKPNKICKTTFFIQWITGCVGLTPERRVSPIVELAYFL